MKSSKHCACDAALALVRSCREMDKDQIKKLPDLDRCDFYEFDVRSYGREMEKIGIYFNGDDIIVGVSKPDAPGKFYKIIRTADTIADFQTSLLTLASSLRGDEFEKSFIRGASKKKPSDASWSEKLRFEKTFLFYEEIHEYISGTLINLLKMHDFARIKNYKILDIFGGDGRLINRLCDRLRTCKEFEPITFEFIYVDWDPVMFDRAVNRFRMITDDRFHIKPIRSDLRKREKPDIGQVDLVLCSGGLTGEVIGPEAAISITEWIYARLKTSGIFIATGKADSHINKRILSQIGFYVSNCAMIDREVKYGIIHHYVSMKPNHPVSLYEPLSSRLMKSVLHDK